MRLYLSPSSVSVNAFILLTVFVFVFFVCQVRLFFSFFVVLPKAL